MELKTDVFYIFPEDGSIAWSPDGIGCYWYDSMAEAIDDVGEWPMSFQSKSADFWKYR